MRIYDHSSTGKIHFHPDDWVLVMCDKEIVDYYHWLSKRYGKCFHKGSRFGAHITIAKGRFKIPEKIKNLYQDHIVNFDYTHKIYYNQNHLWLNVQSDELTEIHKRIMETDVKKLDKTHYSFHMTLGRLQDCYI